MKLTDVNLLDELAKPEHAELRAQFMERTHAKGALIYQPGEGPDLVFVVSSGRVRIYLASVDKEFTVAILEPGAVYSTHTRAFVEAMDECVLLVTETGRFHAGLRSYPELTGAMINVLGGLLKNSFSIIHGLVFHDASLRLVGYLLEEARHGEPCDDKGCRIIRLGLLTEEMAKIVGATRQTVSMLISDLVRSGDLVKLGRGEYLIPDLTRLEARLS
ncbi:MAG: Crp/Fnr family transcriptional regulator [Deltaproteobacteria bacterium]|nr:Crp/Fnr family transcriptional regulator [Deltaproteobacteria bacterium]